MWVSIVMTVIRNTTDMIYYFPKQRIGRKFIINFVKVDYKISTMVAFCPGGLLSGVGIFGGLLSGGLLSVHHVAYYCNVLLSHQSAIAIC